VRIRNLALWGMALVVLGFINFLIHQREDLAVNGKVILLELAPVDPRSLIQGDYMSLRYALSEEIANRTNLERGFVVVLLDENNVARYVRIHDSISPLADYEVLLPFRREAFSVNVGPKSFFFQEGHDQYYNNAKYGELRISDSGQILLVGLRNERFDVLGAP
jgi:uncharacterized membrane-anchored protein